MGHNNKPPEINDVKQEFSKKGYVLISTKYKNKDTKLEDNTAFLPGVVSRKKQILPVLMNDME